MVITVGRAMPTGEEGPAAGRTRSGAPTSPASMSRPTASRSLDARCHKVRQSTRSRGACRAPAEGAAMRGRLTLGLAAIGVGTVATWVLHERREHDVQMTALRQPVEALSTAVPPERGRASPSPPALIKPQLAHT